MLITSFLFGVGATVGRFVGECIIVILILLFFAWLFRR